MLSGKIQFAEPLTAILAKHDSSPLSDPDLAEPSVNAVQTRVEDSPLFYRLSIEERRSVISMARQQCFASHKKIFHEGDPASAIFLLASGRVKLTRLSRKWEQVLLRVVDQYEVVGQLGLSAGSWHTLTAETMTTSRVLTWGIQVFEGLCERIPELASNSLHIVANSQRVLEERFLEQITAPTPARLARLLVRLVEKSGGSIHKPARIEGLLRQEFAQMIGTTMFTVSRLLCQWQRLGILEPQRETVVIKDPRRLIQFAEQIWTNDEDG